MKYSISSEMKTGITIAVFILALFLGWQASAANIVNLIGIQELTYPQNTTNLSIGFSQKNIYHALGAYGQLQMYFNDYADFRCYTVYGSIALNDTARDTEVVDMTGFDLIDEIDWKWAASNSTDGDGCLDDATNTFVFIYGNDVNYPLEAIARGTAPTTATSTTTSYIVNSNQDFTNGLFLFFLIFFGLLFYADRWFKKERR